MSVNQPGVVPVAPLMKMSVAFEFASVIAALVSGAFACRITAVLFFGIIVAAQTRLQSLWKFCCRHNAIAGCLTLHARSPAPAVTQAANRHDGHHGGMVALGFFVPVL